MAKVYVSSTVSDLRSERQAVIDWLVAAGHQPVHSYRPDSETVRDSCLSDIDGCDLYVLILGHRYGFQPEQENPEKLSITHLEFRRAKQSGIPRIALLRISIPDVRLSDLRDPHKAALRDAFEEEVRSELRPAEFSDSPGLITGLSTGVQTALEKLRRKHDSAPSAASAQVPVWNIPRPTHHFQDRPELIAGIDEALARRGATALTALHGFAGIGKTELARRFAELHRESYQLGAWIEAETTVSLLESFAKLAPLLGVPPENDQQAMAALVINALCLREPWLVVFDNAESPETLRDHVKQLHGNGHVLITSRSEQWDSLAEAVSVTQWNEEESVRFLLARTGQSDSAAAGALVRDLDGLVLALEHAAAFIRAGDGMLLAEYRRTWRQKISRTPRGHEYPQSVAAALGLSLDKLRLESGLAHDLLSLFVWLAPDRIPRKELLEAGAAKLPDVLRAALAERETWGDLVETLGRYSLASRERSDGIEVAGYRLHRVVQQVMRDRLAVDGESIRWLAVACDIVDEAFPSEPHEPRSWASSAALLPHARAIRLHAAGLPAPSSLGRLLNQASVYLQVRGLYGEARDFLELALESDLRQFGPDHPNVAVHRSNLANILSALGEHQAARQQIELALESDLRQFGPDHPNVAVDRSNLAPILRALSEHQPALREINEALRIFRHKLPPGHPDIRNAAAWREIILKNAAP